MPLTQECFTQVGGVRYNAREIRVHTPAEHIIDDERAQLELQVIHELATPSFGPQVRTSPCIFAR